ncbi:MAG: aminotransferase class V-fold PLP-dependent enzyme [Rhodospirillaceae bacterium]|nr:aminotransferase class V-fold PLP-dependent enzyme [Rhodospirillaceae bacterium]
MHQPAISPTAAGTNLPRLPVYLDYQATTPTDPRVVAAMLPWFTERFGNPHSDSHAYGREAAEAVETARARIAALVGAEAREIVFTSGATESNNLALKGVLRFRRDGRRHLVTCVTEHKCVLESARALEAEGFRVTLVPVDRRGLVDLDRLAEAVSEETALVSVMAVNNEIGVIQPLAEIAAIAHARGAWFHTDAAQAVGKIPIDVAAMGIDLMSISAHKLYGPKGIGALYLRRRPRVRLEPLIHGGGQERGVRSGTLPTPLCVGFGEACAIAGAEMAAEAARLADLARRLHGALARAVPDLALNGDAERRIPGNLNLTFPGCGAQALMAAAPEVAVSTGSACTSAAVEPSYVLRALGLDEAAAAASVRIGLGRFTTEAEVDFAAERLAAAALRVRGDIRAP